MKLSKIFTIFTFLLAFAIQVSAEDEKPKIVWKNLQEKYERFEDIKPIIRNLTDKSIYLVDTYYSVKLAYFNELKSEWITNYPSICGTGVKLEPFSVKPQNEEQLIIGKGFWNLNTQIDRDRGLDMLGNLRNVEIGKFRLELSYGVKKSQIWSLISTSSEFQVKIPKS